MYTVMWYVYTQMVCIQSNGMYTVIWYVYSQMVCIQSNDIYTVKWYVYISHDCIHTIWMYINHLTVYIPFDCMQTIWLCTYHFSILASMHDHFTNDLLPLGDHIHLTNRTVRPHLWSTAEKWKPVQHHMGSESACQGNVFVLVSIPVSQQPPSTHLHLCRT